MPPSIVRQLIVPRDTAGRFWVRRVNMKPPQVETIVDWHQDLSYYPLTNRDSVAVLLYLDDADEENGALRVVPREQSRPDAMLDHASEDGFFQGRIPAYVRPRHATPYHLPAADAWVHAQGSPDGEDSPPDQQILEAPAGSAIFLGALTPHASVRPLFDPFLDLRLASNVRAEPLCLKTEPCAAPVLAGAESVGSLPADADHLLPHGGQFPAVPERRAIHHREGRPLDLRNPQLLTTPLDLSTLSAR